MNNIRLLSRTLGLSTLLATSAALAGGIPVGNAMATATAISATSGFGAVDLYDESAQMLFWSTIAIGTNNDGVKQGPGFSCEGHSDPFEPAKSKRHHCRFYYDAAGNLSSTGSVTSIAYETGLSSVSTLIPSEYYLTKGLFWGSVSLYDGVAQQIFDGMTAVNEDSKGLKKGKSIQCMRPHADGVKYSCTSDYEGHGRLGFFDNFESNH